MDLSALTGMFVGLHTIAAHALSSPELEITPDEGQAFMAAAAGVLRHYSVSATQKTLDWIALAGVVGGIYGPRLFAMKMRHAAARDAGTNGQDALPSPTGEPAAGYRFAA